MQHLKIDFFSCKNNYGIVQPTFSWKKGSLGLNTHLRKNIGTSIGENSILSKCFYIYCADLMTTAQGSGWT